MFSKGTEKIVNSKNSDTVIAEAIEALNELTTHYQDISAPITIKLAVP